MGGQPVHFSRLLEPVLDEHPLEPSPSNKGFTDEPKIPGDESTTVCDENCFTCTNLAKKIFVTPVLVPGGGITFDSGHDYREARTVPLRKSFRIYAAKSRRR